MILRYFSLKICSIFCFVFCFISVVYGQNATQNIKGLVLDKQAQLPIPGVLLLLTDGNQQFQTKTDANGQFIFRQIKPGRYDLKATYSGFKPASLANLLLTNGKELDLEILMEESVQQMGEVTVKAEKKGMNNELTTVSGRAFTMDDVNKYAGGRSDPARMAANFAGVSSPDDTRNDLVIRGNSPVGVLWRVEGMALANPNHFSTIGTTGGPISAINTNLLRNSDFMTSAFPSEYGNAVAGVFDLGLRNGNTSKREHTFQFGFLTGIEAMTEGPIRKDNGSSYLIAYRYGFSSVAKSIGLPIGTFATPYYQDISFKINSGQTKFGKFTLFGIGALSKVAFMHDKIDTTDLFAFVNRDSYFTSQIGLLGLKHNIRIKEKAYINTVIGTNYLGSNYLQDSISSENGEPVRTIENLTQRLTFSLNSSFNWKISAKVFIKAGILSDALHIKLLYRNREKRPDWEEYWNANEVTFLTQVFAHVKYNFTDNVVLNVGVHGQHFSLNNAKALEPRVGLKYQVNGTSAFSFGYGLHSQLQPLDAYFFKDGENEANRNLDFTRSHHLVLGYDWQMSKNWKVKTEVYYQYLFNVPVHQYASSYSMLNAGASFFPNNQVNLENTGTGENYGVELTLERFFAKGFYGMVTGSLYNATYTPSDGIERNTAFNGKYVYNVLVGQEIKVGKEKRNAFSIDVKFTHAGGRFYTPINLPLSQLVDFQVLMGDAYAFSERYPYFLRLDVKVGYRYNSTKRKVSHYWAFDVNNVTNRKNVFADRYNSVSKGISTAYQIGFFPNFVYRVQF